jgi:DHA1 family bicyclomycin/chloramphenicol resistance-like MFS transporter
MVIARATIRDLYVGADAARMFSAMVLVMGLAPILAPLAGGYVLVHGGWRTIFWVLAAFGTVALVATLAALPETLERSTRRTGSLGDALGRIRSVARDARFVVPGMLLALPFAAVFAYISSAPFVLIQYFGVRVEAFGWFFGANALGLIAGSQMNSRLLRRARSAVILRRAIRLQTVMALVLLATATTGAGGLPGVVLPLFFVVASIGFIAPNASAIAMTPFGADAGTASALLGTCQALAGVVATVAVGFMPGSGAVPMAAVIAACTVLAWVIDTFGRRRRSV